MAYEYKGGDALDYYPCRYGKSRLLFRGPRRDLATSYVAVLGGTETYGKFVAEPYPALVESSLGMKVVNLGCMNAGPDVFVRDPALIDIASAARVTVVQISGAQNMSNRFYSVHPRRNDRFLKASSLLTRIYRDVDFTEFNFTRHMLQSLRVLSPERFELVAEELRAAWVARMRQLLGLIQGKTVLLWMADHAPGNPGDPCTLEQDPIFIDTEMLEAVKQYATGYVEVVASPAARARGVEGMLFSALDRPAAEILPNPAVHAEVAAALAPVLRDLA